MNLIGALILSSCLMLGSITEEDRIKKLKKIRTDLNTMGKEKRLEYPEINTLVVQAKEELQALQEDAHYRIASSQALAGLSEARLKVIDLKPEGLRDSWFSIHLFLQVTGNKKV